MGSNEPLYKNMKPHKDKKYRPTPTTWRKIREQTGFISEPFHEYEMELINFETSQIHLKSGKRISFACLNESEYVHVVNGGYYEEAPPINDNERI